MYSHLTIGVLALQGDFERHLYRLSVLQAKGREIRTKNDLSGIDGLIIPGGESTTVSMLIDRFSMRDELKRFCDKRPVWGTCAGMIMLAREVDDSRVKPLDCIDINVNRNGYGRQVHSFHAEIKVNLGGREILLPSSFIRAPIVTAYGLDVEVLAAHGGSPILLMKDNCLVSSFHTELDEDPALTAWFLDNFVLANMAKKPVEEN